MLGVNYGPDENPLAILEQRTRGAISVYAQGDDYHDVIKKRLKALARWLVADVRRRGEGVRRYRRRDGKAAGAGGRTRLAGQAHQSGVARVRLVAVSRRDLHHARPAARRRRQRSLRLLPAPASTSARPRRFPRPTSSMRGAAFPISPSRTRARSRTNSAKRIGNRIYGCDDCLAVCPWNKFAQAGPRSETRRARRTCARRRLPNWRGSTTPAFRALFREIAGQAHRPRPLRAQCADRDRQLRTMRRWPRRPSACLDDASPLVRGAAVWALSQLIERESSRRWRRGD